MFSFFRSALFAPCLIAFGLFFVYIGHKDGVEVAAMADHGKTAKAEITKVEWKEKESSHSDSEYSVNVVFITEDGREINSKMAITLEFGRALRNQATTPDMMVC